MYKDLRPISFVFAIIGASIPRYCAQISVKACLFTQLCACSMVSSSAELGTAAVVGLITYYKTKQIASDCFLDWDFLHPQVRKNDNDNNNNARTRMRTQ